MSDMDKNNGEGNVIDLSQRRDKAKIGRFTAVDSMTNLETFAILNVLLFAIRNLDEKLIGPTRAEVQKLLASCGHGTIEDPKELESLLAQEVEKRQKQIKFINLAFLKHCLLGCKDPDQRTKIQEKIAQMEEELSSARGDLSRVTRK